MGLIKVWWRVGLVQAVHVQAAEGRTVCGIEVPDSARTGPGREVACDGCRAALGEASRPAVAAGPTVQEARVADLVAENDRLQAQLRSLRPKVATLEQVRDRLAAEKMSLHTREGAAVARAAAAEAALAEAEAEIELLRLSLADERRRVEQRDRLGAVRHAAAKRAARAARVTGGAR